MIAAESTIEVAWVNLQAVVFDDQDVNPDQVQFYVDQLTGHDGHLAPPILNQDMSIRDGRHRLLAHMLLGRGVARCLIVHPPADVRAWGAWE